MSDVMEQLKAIGKPPKGCIVCPACGAVLSAHVPAENRRLKAVFGFVMSGCIPCGHAFRIDGKRVRDLTREEAAIVAAHPKFQQSRDRVDASLRERGLWG